ncbi:MAG: hypothetical protein ACRBFS_15155, partial [Aureispira sp.]
GLEEVQHQQAPTVQINELLALKSPLPTLEKPVETQIVQAEEGETLTYASGSTVRIPAAAFVDEKGAPVKGAVEITYREFNDPVDMFLAGVPKELNKHQDLQSTGMMEIKGFQNGAPVFLSMDKKLNIELQGKMAAEMKPEELGVYVYSRQKDAWNYQAKDQVERLTNSKEENSTPQPLKDLEPIIAQLKEEQKANKPIPPIRPGVPNNMQVFDFDIDLNNAPELKQYAQEIDFMASIAAFPPATFDTVWNNMKLTKNTGGDYMLTLEYENEQGQVTTRVSKVEPVVVATEAAKVQFRKEQRRYEEALGVWEEGIVALAQNQVAATQTLVSIINRFEIQRFGLWNCGKPVQWEQDIAIATQFVDLEGAPIALQEVFVATQQQFYYSAVGDKKRTSVPLPYKEELTQKIWAMSTEGELLVAETPTTATDMNRILPMRPVAVPSSAADLRELLTL